MRDTAHTRPLAMAESKQGAQIVVMVNGLPGNMGHAVSAACLRRGFAIASVALKGRGVPTTVEVSDGAGGPPTAVTLHAGGEEGTEAALQACIDAERAAGRVLVAIDFTHPTAVNPNGELYAKLRLPFVMGTTGGDRDALLAVTTASGGYAVIAANMSKQIVALQTMLESMATQFPGAYVRERERWERDGREKGSPGRTFERERDGREKRFPGAHVREREHSGRASARERETGGERDGSAMGSSERERAEGEKDERERER